MHGGIPITLLATAVAALAPQPQATAKPPLPAPAVSTAHLPRFPYLRWPGEFVPRNSPVEQTLGHFRFWDGNALQDVEGRTYLVTLVRRDRGRPFDEPLIRRTIEDDLARMGAVRIVSGRIPPSAIATINDADKQALLPGLGDFRDPVQTWIIRRPDRQIWVQFTGNPSQTSIAVVATLPD